MHITAFRPTDNAVQPLGNIWFKPYSVHSSSTLNLLTHNMSPHIQPGSSEPAAAHITPDGKYQTKAELKSFASVSVVSPPSDGPANRHAKWLEKNGIMLSKCFLTSAASRSIFACLVLLSSNSPSRSRCCAAILSCLLLIDS